jgi:hypothetical protein
MELRAFLTAAVQGTDQSCPPRDHTLHDVGNEMRTNGRDQTVSGSRGIPCAGLRQRSPRRLGQQHRFPGIRGQPERHEALAFLAEDADKLRAYLGAAASLRMVK